jgi:hypothetical protein
MNQLIKMIARSAAYHCRRIGCSTFISVALGRRFAMHAMFAVVNSPYCQEHTTLSHVKAVKQQAALNDPGAYYTLGCKYRDGIIGLLQSHEKAFEFEYFSWRLEMK